MSEKQLKAIEAEYRELVQSSSSSIRKDKAGVRVVEISVLRKLCQAESGVITGKKGKGKESANAKALDLICEILREGRSSECGEGLPLDLDLAGQLVGLAKGSIETFGARKAVSLLDILVTDYPKVVVNASVLPDTISQLVALRRTGKDEDKKEGEEEKEEGDEDEDRECFERILEFYGSYCLGYFDQLRVLQTNLTKIFPALLQSLGAQDGNKKVAIEALHSLIVTPLAKDMCERAFGVKDETDITAPPA